MAGSLEPAFLFLGHKKELLLIDYLSILQQPLIQRCTRGVQSYDHKYYSISDIAKATPNIRKV